MGVGVERKEAAVLRERGTGRALLDGAAEAFGYARSELLGKHFELLLAERLRAEYMQRWDACFTRLKTEAPQDVYEAVAVRKTVTRSRSKSA